jgi:hypothetical protein
MRHRLEYLIVRALVAIMRVTPGVVVRAAGTTLGLAFYAAISVAERLALSWHPSVRSTTE